MLTWICTHTHTEDHSNCCCLAWSTQNSPPTPSGNLYSRNLPWWRGHSCTYSLKLIIVSKDTKGHAMAINARWTGSYKVLLYSIWALKALCTTCLLHLHSYSFFSIRKCFLSDFHTQLYSDAKDTLACKMVQSGIKPPKLQLIDNLLYLQSYSQPHPYQLRDSWM